MPAKIAAKNAAIEEAKRVLTVCATCDGIDLNPNDIALITWKALRDVGLSIRQLPSPKGENKDELFEIALEHEICICHGCHEPTYLENHDCCSDCNRPYCGGCYDMAWLSPESSIELQVPPSVAVTETVTESMDEGSLEVESDDETPSWVIAMNGEDDDSELCQII